MNVWLSVPQKQAKTHLDSESWTTIREFEQADPGEITHAYRAKYVESVEQEHVEDDIVLVKEVDSLSGGERMYHLPAEVCEGIVDRLP
jgi:hypothetical protein